MGLIAILIGGLIIAFSCFYLINDLALNRNNLNEGPTGINQTPVSKAKDIQIISDFQLIQTALNLYKVQNGQYPDKLQKLSDEELVQIILKNPYTQTEYSYKVSGDSYILSTNLGTGKLYQVRN